MMGFKLLVHHHAVAFQSAGRGIHLPSFIGRWVNALAGHVDEIGLLLYTSDTLLTQQDEVIDRRNVRLWSLGPPGQTWDRIPRMRRLKQVCQQASQSADGLLVRGMTPRQMSIWKNVNVPNKAFLLVGSLLQSQPEFKPTFWGLYERWMLQWRKIEVRKMARHGVMMANSPELVSEMQTLAMPAYFVPTNSISLTEFSHFEVRKPSIPRKILFCGRVVPEKGIRELVQALAKVEHAQPCVLDIVGPVDGIFRDELDRMANQLGVARHIRWHGRVPYGDKLMAFYRNADVLVLPTYYEGFPHVIWEAAANCCPVIASDVGGIPSLWQDGEHGMLILPKNVAAIVEALQSLFGDDALRARLVREAYSYSRNFAVESCAVRLVDHLREQGWTL